VSQILYGELNVGSMSVSGYEIIYVVIAGCSQYKTDVWFLLVGLIAPPMLESNQSINPAI
jgi:uncharacterized membrane protein YuzA (DUF378 family)